MNEYHPDRGSGTFDIAQSRQDIVIETNPDLAEALKFKTEPSPFEAVVADTVHDDKRLQIRRTLIEPAKSDPNGFERVIGASDLLSINFLARGIRTAAAVCRIRVPSLGGEWFGSGFMVGPRLLMTNHHVLSSRNDASQTEAEFGYEHDLDGVLNPPVQFNLAPHELFFTDVDHDVTFVAVSPLSEGGVPIERFGYLPLIPLSGKGIDGEWVTIIQHPGGQPKQMTIRKSQIVELDKNTLERIFRSKAPDRFIHYTTDTEPGSSGAPVLNDQLQVVAIHHKAVPDPSSLPDGTNKAQPSDIKWLANQGVRISSIYSMLESKRFSNKESAAVLERLSRSIGFPPLRVPASITLDSLATEKEGKPLSEDHWTGQELGYDPEFLPIEITIDDILSGQRDRAAKLKSGNDEVVLDYLHFSSVIDEDRKLPMLTAVNIHGAKLINLGKTSNSWRRDSRMDDIFQPGDNLYKGSLGDDPVAFQRGHLVRRLNACWGNSKDEARLAEKHTYHFSNAAPQIARYNNVDWGDLEDYVLDRTQTLDKKVTVFSGPVFKGTDPEYGHKREHGPWQIPVTFWKIAVIEKAGGTISAAAFLVGQIEYLGALFEARVFTKGLHPYTFNELKERKIQTTIKNIEEETGLDFSALHEFDALNALESTRQTRFFRHSSEIII